ncbi:uncharacterized protein LOC144450864 [Glandiceps talaboti]
MKLQLFVLVTILAVSVTSREASYTIPCNHDCNCVDYFWVDDEEGASDIQESDANTTNFIPFGRFHILEVDCRSRNLRGDIPLVLGNATRLMLSHNNFRTIPANSFRDYSNVAELDLTYCGIKEIHETAFHGMMNIRVISLTGNELVSLPDGIFKGLPNLFALYLDYNHFKEFPPLKPVDYLSSLHMNYNELEKVSADVFADSVRLVRLGLYSNKLTTFPASLASFLQEKSPSALVTIGNNPWQCDCNMLEIKKIWPTHPRVLFDSFYCATPHHLKDQNMWHIAESEFVCGVTTDDSEYNERAPTVYTMSNMVGAVFGAAICAAVLTSVVWLVVLRRKAKHCYNETRANSQNSFVQLENKDEF